MPKVEIEWAYDLMLSDDVLEEVAQNLRPVLAKELSVGEWTLKEEDFGFAFTCVRSPSSNTHLIVVRMVLHNFPERESREAEIRHAIGVNILGTLDSCRCLPWREFPESLKPWVGVSLVFAPISWGTVSVEDYYLELEKE